MTTSNESNKATTNSDTTALKKWHTPELRVLEIQANTQGGNNSGPNESGFYNPS